MLGSTLKGLPQLFELRRLIGQRRVLPRSWSSSRSQYSQHNSSSIWTIYNSPALSVHRLLRQAVCTCQERTTTGQERCKVSALIARRSWLTVCSNTGIAYVCGYCQTPALQPFGRMFDKPTASNPERSTQTFKSAPGTAKGESCEHCGSTTHVSRAVSSFGPPLTILAGGWPHVAWPDPRECLCKPSVG